MRWLQIPGGCLSLIDSFHHSSTNNCKQIIFPPTKTVFWPAAHPEGLHMTSMDICWDDLWFMPEAEPLKWSQALRALPTYSCWSAITEVSSRLCSASTLAAVHMPTDNHWHRWWAETQTDRQRKRTTHRSKKTGRLYTHCPREDIAWQ